MLEGKHAVIDNHEQLWTEPQMSLPCHYPYQTVAEQCSTYGGEVSFTSALCALLDLLIDKTDSLPGA